MKKIIYLLIIAISFSSCSSKLSTDDALKILQEDYKEKCYSKVQNRIYNKKPAMSVWKKLSKQGLINIKKFGCCESTFTFTNKARKEYNSNGRKVATQKSKVISVNGISNKDGEAIVNFTIEFTETPFYQLGNCRKSKEVRDVRFIKYDNGWKIKK